MTANNVAVGSTRKLFEILNVGRLADNEIENCDEGDLTFITLLRNIAECKSFDMPNAKFPLQQLKE